MTRDLVVGVEMIEFATITGGVVNDDWLRIENIEAGSVVITSNKDTQTPVLPEDKSLPILILYTPGDADVFTFGLLEISADNLARFFNTIIDVATSSTLILAKKKYANLALRITTTPQLGYQHRFTYSNTTCLPSWKNNLAKAATLVISVDASILPYTDVVSGQDAVGFIELLHDDGTVVDSTPPTVSAGGPTTTSTSATKALTGTASAASPKTIVKQFWSLVSGPAGSAFSAPSSLTTNITGLVTGVYVAMLTATDSEGIQATSIITITATVA